MKRALHLLLILIPTCLLFSCSTSQMTSKRYQKIQKVTVEVNKQEKVEPVTKEAFNEVEVIKAENDTKIAVKKAKANNKIAIEAPKSAKKANTKEKNPVIAAKPSSNTMDVHKQIAVEKLDAFFADHEQRLEMQRPQGSSRWAFAITSIVAAVISGLMFAAAILGNFTIGAAFGLIFAAVAIVFGSLGIARRWKQSRIIAIVGLTLGAILFVAWIIMIALYAAGIIL